MKSSLSFIFFFIVKFMENWNDVELDEESDMSQTIESFLQLRNRISVFDDDVVKFLIIHIYLNISLRFADKNYWKVDEKCAEMYEFFLKILIQSLFEHFEFISDHRIQRAVLWFCFK